MPHKIRFLLIITDLGDKRKLDELKGFNLEEVR